MQTARRIINKHHYAKGASNTAVYIHGLFPAKAFWNNDCRGVTWWIPPTKSAAIATYPENWRGVLSLSRMAIMPETPKNACTFLLSRSTKLIDPEKWPCLVTYADQWRGHTGGIYKAANWEYVGTTNPEAVYTRNGRMVSRKAGPKTRTRKEMEELGCRSEGKHAKHKYRLVLKGNMEA